MDQLQLFSAQATHHSVDVQRYLRRLGDLDRLQHAALARLRALALRRQAIVVDTPDTSPTKRPRGEDGGDMGHLGSATLAEEREFQKCTGAISALSEEKAAVCAALTTIAKELDDFLTFRLVHFRTIFDAAAANREATRLRKT